MDNSQFQKELRIAVKKLRNGIRNGKRRFSNLRDEFITKIAHNIEKACKFVEVGFDYSIR